MRFRTTLFTILIMFTAAGASRGQAPSVGAATSDAIAPDTMARGGPRAEVARVGIARNASVSAPARAADAVPAPAFVQATRERGRTMMLVGGVVFLGGLLIGDDVGTAIAVTGLAIGVWGFYQLIR